MANDWDFDEWGALEDDTYESPAAKRLQELLEGLTEPQRQSVEHRDAPLVIIAGAGTGKTTALTRRIGHIITSGDGKPEEILVVTFTTKAARELEKRLKSLLDDSLDGITVGTFHAICARMLRDHYHEFGVPQDYVIMDADDQKRLVKRIGKELFGKNVDKDLIDASLAFIENVRGNPDTYDKEMASCDPTIREITRHYEKAKRDDNVLDFTDLINIVVDCFRLGLVDPQIFRDKWKHVLVDEYQDTNGLQFTWLKYIAGNNPNIAVVGDDDQVLYSWRGARIENILEFPESFEDTKVIKLEQNFRSTGHILDAANHLIGHNKARMGKTLFTNDEAGEKPKVLTFADAEAEARWVVEEVKRHIANGLKPTDIAILSRASHVLHLIEQKMTFAGIPFVLSGGKRFQDKAEIRDAVAYLRLATNPEDSTAFERVVNSPKRGMGDVAIRKILDATDKARELKVGMSLMTIARNYTVGKSLHGDVPRKLGEFVDVIERANRVFWRGGTAEQILDITLKESGYLDEMERALKEAKEENEKTTQETLDTRLKSLQDLMTIARGKAPLELIEHLGLSEDGRSRKATGVWIGTIHAAKGLEWPVVIGVGWENNVLPSWQALSEGAENVAEERRCGYVLITRARQYLTLTTTGERFNQPAIRSRFLDELPEKSVEEKDLSNDS